MNTGLIRSSKFCMASLKQLQFKRQNTIVYNEFESFDVQ